MLLNLNPRRIIYYTPYSEPVWPNHRFSMRVLHKLTVEEGREKNIPHQA
jgi:hypothetical protein